MFEAAVTAEKISEWWSRVEGARGIYKAGDGSSLSAFRQSILGAIYVWEFPWGLIWFDAAYDPRLLLHPVIWSPRAFRAKKQVEVLFQEMGRRLRPQSFLVRIPRGQRSLERLAKAYGFIFTGIEVLASFQYATIPCRIWERER